MCRRTTSPARPNEKAAPGTLPAGGFFVGENSYCCVIETILLLDPFVISTLLSLQLPC